MSMIMLGGLSLRSRAATMDGLRPPCAIKAAEAFTELVAIIDNKATVSCVTYGNSVCRRTVFNSVPSEFPEPRRSISCSFDRVAFGARKVTKVLQASLTVAASSGTSDELLSPKQASWASQAFQLRMPSRWPSESRSRRRETVKEEAYEWVALLSKYRNTLTPDSIPNGDSSLGSAKDACIKDTSSSASLSAA
eukprot:scaffold1446_cov391-Prasinococcus_capsulatus_cf.AAC.4